jgi:hypothetical protein
MAPVITMDYNEWKKDYNQILLDFGFSKKEDEKSAVLLSKLLVGKKLVKPKDLNNMISNRDVYVFGAGNSLEEDIKKVKNDDVFISADTATSLLIERNITPDIIVTDLDGVVEDEVKVNKKGAIVVVHAHGNNIDMLKRYVPMFDGKLIGTTQSKPFDNIYNFGGFSDGDRAVCLADCFGAKKIFLAGFDFENVGKYSKSKELKIKKLEWAKRIIEKIDNVYFV